MKITRGDALVILEAIGNIGRYAGNSEQEEELESKIRESFSDDKEVYEYDYSEQAKKYGW